jgi:RNA polymerase sigma-70 factor (ECF subfamily)
MIAPNTNTLDLDVQSADHLDEAELVARCARSDAAACEQLVRRYSGRMLAVAGRFLPCESDRDDAVQDAFIAALRSIGSFHADAQLSTWLHRITVNSCLMKLRSRSRRPEMSIEDQLPSFDERGQHEQSVVEWRDQTFDAVAAAETRRLVRDAINRLPEPYRTVLLLRDIEEMATDQTARMLNISTAAVKTRLHRARQALRTLLAPHMEPLAA